MTHEPRITCDAPGCQNEKRAVNHWYSVIVRREPREVIIVPWERGLVKLAEKEINKPYMLVALDACGQRCALQIASAAIDQWNDKQAQAQTQAPVPAPSAPPEIDPLPQPDGDTSESPQMTQYHGDR